jgi:hypothetical protein
MDLVPVYAHGPWRIFRNPEPQEWPEPTDVQLAARTRAAIDEAVPRWLARGAMASVGVQPAAASARDEVLYALIDAVPWLHPVPARMRSAGWPPSPPALWRTPPVPEPQRPWIPTLVPGEAERPLRPVADEPGPDPVRRPVRMEVVR